MGSVPREVVGRLVILNLLLGGAALVAILAGVFAALSRVGKTVVNAIDERIDLKLAPINQKLEREFGGNGNGARQAINELHEKVDGGFAEVRSEVTAVTARLNTIESNRATRDGDKR